VCQKTGKMPRNPDVITDNITLEPKKEMKEAQNDVNRVQNGSVLLNTNDEDDDTSITARNSTGTDIIVEQGDDICPQVSVDIPETDNTISYDEVNRNKSDGERDTIQNKEDTSSTSGSDDSVADEITLHTHESVMTDPEMKELNLDNPDKVISQETTAKPNNILRMTKLLWTSAEHDDYDDPDLNIQHTVLSTETKDNDDDDDDDEDDVDGVSSTTLYDR